MENPREKRRDRVEVRSISIYSKTIERINNYQKMTDSRSFSEACENLIIIGLDTKDKEDMSC